MNKSQWKFQYRSFIRCWVINFQTTAFINLSIFLCYLTDFDKNGTNTWKNMKVSANTSEHRTNLSQNFNAVASFVLELLGFLFIHFIFLCFFVDFDKNGTNNWKNTKLCESHLDYWDMPQAKFQCLRFFSSWVIRLSLYKDILYFYVLLQTLIKAEQTIEKTPNFMEIIISAWTIHNQSLNVLGCLVPDLLGLKLC